MKILVVAGCVLALAVAGCEDNAAPTKQSSVKGWTIVCVEGYEYIMHKIPYKGFMAPKFNAEGKPNKCDLGSYTKQ